MLVLFAQGEAISGAAKTAVDKMIEGGTIAIVVLILLAMICGIAYLAVRFIMPALMEKWVAGEVWYQKEIQRKDDVFESTFKEQNLAYNDRFKEQADAFVQALTRSELLNKEQADASREQGEKFLSALKEMRVDQREEMKAIISIATTNLSGVNSKLESLSNKLDAIQRLLTEGTHENPRSGR